MKTFGLVWTELVRHLKPGLIIPNWTAMRGYLGDGMTVVGIRDEHIETNTPKAKMIQVVPRADFEKVWQLWPDYQSRKLSRFQLRDMTRYSKYIISILHWYEQNVG